MIQDSILISGNNRYGVSAALAEIYPDMQFASRTNGFDLCTKDGQKKFAEKALEHNKIIISSALYRFNQTLLLEAVIESCKSNQHRPHIVVCGSTIDRFMNGNVRMYKAEKRAIRDYCNSLSIDGVWGAGPKVTLISFGTLSNNAHKHPDRRTTDIHQAVQYIKWIFDQPKDVNINEISLDPMQGDV